MAEFDFKIALEKWSKYWEDNKIYHVEIDPTRPKYYILDMFPYPSGAGLHVGHPLGYIATDIVSRYQRLKGYNVLHPMGFDSFGLPAEQYAIQTGQHPAVTTENNIKRYKEQLRNLAFSYDWSREIKTSDPSYYKWTQWIFCELFNAWYDKKSDRARPIAELEELLAKEGNSQLEAVCDDDTYVISSTDWQTMDEEERQKLLLKYRLTYISEATVNWCPALGTVLSNDEVKDGFSERGGYPVIKKQMKQWSMRISAYADRLLRDLDTLEWPEAVKEMQRNWIGRSEGAEIEFAIEGFTQKIKVFTTRIDTIYGVTFLTLAPEHELVDLITIPAQKQTVDAYVKDTASRSERDRMADVKRVTGEFTGAYAINPFSKEKVPIWIADYVLAGYGTGAVMAVPSGDQRDYDFAKQFNLPIKPIYDTQNIEQSADPTKEGKLINSGLLNGLTYNDGIKLALEFIEKTSVGSKKINFRIRDAIFGRQRYWGEPIPVYFKKNIPYLLPHHQLPLVLPSISKFLPTEDGDPPLGRASEWKTAENHSYELTTMPGWAGSSWYFFRYMDPHNDFEFASSESLAYWKQVDLYVGGSEHATGHLLYSRFWTKFLFDRGLIQYPEYAKKLVNQGMIQGRSSLAYRIQNTNTYVSKELVDDYQTYPIHVDVNLVKDDILDIEAFKNSRPDANTADFILFNNQFTCGWEIEKMSKSKLNVVNPDDLVEKYGADTVRMYEMFLGPLEQSKPWNTNGIEGVYKFLRKFYNLFYVQEKFLVTDEEPTQKENKVLHSLLKKLEVDVASLSLNTSVSSFMIATNDLSQMKCNKRKILQPLVIALSPFAPVMAEELWHAMGNSNSVVGAKLPDYEDKWLIEEQFEYPISVNGKLRAKLMLDLDLSIPQIERAALEHETVKKWLEGKAPKKLIVVPGKIINVVV